MAFAAALSRGKTTADHCPGFASPIYEYAVYPVYDNDGKLTQTVTIEKDPEKQKEMPDRALEVVETGSNNDENRDTKKTQALGQPPLTDREKQVLRLLSGGSTNNDISEMLRISPHTVKSHVIHIFNKLGVNDRTQAAVLAAKHDLI
ncbi:MAG: response regulator transcription factor [Proteobacteria bacterium]|nr:response regulator transcription factor [Pseudomonadota bacterium]